MLGGLIDSIAGLLRRSPPPAEYVEAELEAARGLLAKDLREDVINRLTPLLERVPDHAEAHYLRGTAMLELKRATEALPDLISAVNLNPREARFRYNLAAAQSYLGDGKSAVENCKAVVSESNFALAHGLWASIELPGENYFTQLKQIHDYLKPQTYLEIGVYKGHSLRLVRPETRVVGIDPLPRLEQPAGPLQTIHAITSDAYFAEHDPVAELGGRVQLAFIDGLHQFEFALRDFVNIERHCNPDSIVMVHDCYPLDRQTAGRERVTYFWSGDVWRLIPLLKKYRPDLSVNVIGTPPTGLGIIRNLDPNSRVLSERMDEIVAEFMALDYSVLDQNKAETLNRYSNEWPQIEELLRPSRKH
jgi:hypothetical protein